MTDIKEINKKLGESTKKTEAELSKLKKELEAELSKLKKELETKLTEFGSFELMANLAVQELVAQSFQFHETDDPVGENPLIIYLLGLFLQKNNLEKSKPHPTQTPDILGSVIKYFDSYKLYIVTMNLDDQKNTDSLVVHSRLHKILGDANPHCYVEQKCDLVTTIFSSNDDFFKTNFGFSINDALEYGKKIRQMIEKKLNENVKMVEDVMAENTKKQIDDDKNNEFLKMIEKEDQTLENDISHFSDPLSFCGSKNTLIINPEKFCKEEHIDDVEKFKKYLNAFSCKIGDQFEDFKNPLSDNILFYKPIIKIDDDSFFIPKVDILEYKLDVLLEYLLRPEKENQTKCWKSHENAKSKYLENKTYEFFSKIFPKKCLYQNLFYNFENKHLETDLILIYDDKIFIIESKSNHLPLYAKRGEMNSLEHSLKKIIKKAYDQATTVHRYIISKDVTEFENKKGKKILTINSKETNYRFFYVNVTLDNLGSIGTNLKELAVFESFSQNKYPWSVNLYDLDIISDCLSEPAYFIHYLEQRIKAQNQNIFHSVAEIIFLGYYYEVGNFYREPFDPDSKVPRIIIDPRYCDVLDEYYLCKTKKPELTIPSKLDELIKNMQKYNQKGFTKITSLLLDFPQEQRKKIAKSIDKKFNKTAKTGNPDGITLSITSFDIGFSYFTSNTMANFYRDCKKHMMQRKHQHKITRWAMIGRNVKDKKNFATFFLYDDSPWQQDDDMDGEISRVFEKN